MGMIDGLQEHWETPANRTQQIDVPSQQVSTLPLQQVNGEEVGSARMPGTTVVRHGRKYCGERHPAQCPLVIAPYDWPRSGNLVQREVDALQIRFH